MITTFRKLRLGAWFVSNAASEGVEHRCEKTGCRTYRLVLDGYGKPYAGLMTGTTIPADITETWLVVPKEKTNG